MIIRTATNNDITSLVKLIKQMIDYHHTLDPYYRPSSEYVNLENEISQWLDDPNMHFLVTEEDGQLLGYLRVGVEEAPLYARTKNIGMIYDIFVEPTKRRLGIAQQLFQKGLEWFDMEKIKNIELNVGVYNKEAAALWHKLGFKDFKLRMRLEKK